MSVVGFGRPCLPLAVRGPSICSNVAADLPFWLFGQRRSFGAGGSYGYGAFFRGEADAAAESNVRRQRLQQDDGWQEAPHQPMPMALKMPETLATLVAEGTLRKPLSRPGVAVYHHHVPHSHERSLVYLTAPTQQAGAPAAAVARSLLQQRERGVAAQLILDGRGVKAYFDPEWPDLMVRSHAVTARL
ncbi:hypothetical protein Emag_004321 [Eimeria magna]